MDADLYDTASPPTSGFKRSISPPTSSPAYKRPNIDWSPSQRTALNDMMKEISPAMGWEFQLEIVGDDVSRWRGLFESVLAGLTFALATTNPKHSVIPLPLPDSAQEVVKGLKCEQFEEWQRGVQKGVKEGDWDDLIAHPIVQKPDAANHLKAETQGERPDCREYRGNAVESFIRGLDVYSKIYDPDRHYGRTIVLLQSSGTGKSRLVHELGKKIPTLSVCFRENPHPTAGWPPGDRPAYAFFNRETSRKVRHKAEELAAAFIGALARVTAEKLEGRIVSGASREDWMKDWVLDTPTDVISPPRYRFFEEVQATAEDLLTENMTSIQHCTEDLNPPATYHILLYRFLCYPHTERLSKILSEAKINRFVIAFDESSNLNLKRIAPNGRLSWDMSVSALQRIIKAGDRFDRHGVTIWYLLLDTNPSLFDRAPSGPYSSSARLTMPLISLPLWPYFGLNQMVGVRHSDGIPTAADALTLEHLKAYGRPYWSSLKSKEVLHAATEKLFPRSFHPKDLDHVFAALAVRVGLELGEGAASERLATDAVHRHMRILRGAIGPLVITVSPSEPVLAIAAAQSLNFSPETYRVAIETLLDGLVLPGLVVDRGVRGELCSRLLLTLARDKAASSFVEDDPRPEGPRVQAVKLSLFLRTLLGRDLGIYGKLESLCSYFLRSVSDIWINFTHIVQLSELLDEVTLPFLCEAWSSGTAFQCATLQPVIGGFFVCYAGDLDAPFDIRNLTTVPWQTSARSRAATEALANELTAPPIVEKCNGEIIRRKPPHLAILMDLAACPASVYDTGDRVNLTRAAATPPAGRRGKWNGYARDDEKEPIRYCLNIRGHDSITYPVLQGFETQFDQLFRRSFGSEEPKFAEFLGAMDDDMDPLRTVVAE